MARDWTHSGNFEGDLEKIIYKDAANSAPSGKTQISLEYDANSSTPTSIDVRFKFARISNSTTNYLDSMYILYDANNNNGQRTLYKLKNYNAAESNWPFYSCVITLTKKFNAEKFFLQDIWICNNQNNVIDATATKFYNNYSSTGSRKNYALRQSSGQSIAINVTKTVATAVSAGTVSFTDNGDNTYTVTGKGGNAGTLNPVKSAKLKYTGGPATGVNCIDKVTKTASIPSDYKDENYPVEAEVTTTGTYGDPVTRAATGTVKYYKIPEAPGKPVISYEKTRLTTREDWTFTWTPAEAGNGNSPIKGYRLRLFKNSEKILGLGLKNNSTYLSKTTGTNEYVDKLGTNCYIKITPSDFGFKTNDIVQLRIYAYTKNGAGEQLFNGGGTPEASVHSEIYKVQSAGTVRVKVNGQWTEGIVYVKDGQWREAEAVYVKNTDWKESQ
jgi:hypothetical protein